MTWIATEFIRNLTMEPSPGYFDFRILVICPRQVHISNSRIVATGSSWIFVLSKVESDITTLHLPKELAERIRRRLKDSDFKNMDDYVAYVLSQIMDEIEGKSQKTEEVFSKKEQGDVEEHLRSLGYM